MWSLLQNCLFIVLSNDMPRARTFITNDFEAKHRVCFTEALNDGISGTGESPLINFCGVTLEFLPGAKNYWSFPGATF